MTGIVALLVALSFSLSAAIRAQAPSHPAQPSPAPSELEYDTYCKKEEREKRRLFRAATPDQKSVLARTQLERWRDANRDRLSKEQIGVLQELWTMATAAMFEGTKEGKATLATFEARADAVFSGAEMDEISPYGPCIPKKPPASSSQLPAQSPPE